MQDFFKFLANDLEMLKSSRAHWTLIPSACAERSAQQNSDSIDSSQNGKRHTYGLRIAYPEEAREINCEGLVVGSSTQAHIQLDHPQVLPMHCWTVPHYASAQLLLGTCSRDFCSFSKAASCGKCTMAIADVNGLPVLKARVGWGWDPLWRGATSGAVTQLLAKCPRDGLCSRRTDD